MSVKPASMMLAIIQKRETVSVEGRGDDQSPGSEEVFRGEALVTRFREYVYHGYSGVAKLYCMLPEVQLP
jgi:hypothetical protein